MESGGVRSTIISGNASVYAIGILLVFGVLRES